MTEELKAIPRLLHMASVVLTANLGGSRRNDPLSRALWLQRHSKRFLNALKMKVRSMGDFPTRGLLVCNHLSYLDIIAIASLGPVVFVAKSDLAGWPLVGSLLRKSGTILAYRNHPIKSSQTALEIKAALSYGLTVVLFPEGTSTGGESVLPFRSPFFQPAHEASVEITPAALRYTSRNGSTEEDICYWGEHVFFPHLIKLAKIKDIVATLKLGETQPCCSDRKKSANYFHKEVTRLNSELKSRV